VVKLLIQYITSLLLILISYSAQAVPQLKMYTDKVETELGRPLRLELIGIDLKEQLTEINIKPLNKHFGVVTDYAIADASDSRWPNKSVQIVHLKLYPRITGKLTIPALKINNIQSNTIEITSHKGKTSVPKVSFSSASPYIRQQNIVTVNVTSADSTSRLSIAKDDAIISFEAQPLAFKRTKQKDGRYLLQIGWALSALKSGTQQLQLPPIEYSVSGVLRKRFFLPSSVIQVKPLPNYLPPTIPVGKISIQSHLKQRYFLSTDALYYWELSLKGQLNNPYQLPPVLRQIKNNNEMRYLAINSQRSVNATENSLTSRVSHSIPFKPSSSGLISFPELHLQYFEPETGTIKTITHQADNIFVLSLFWRSAAIILALLFSAWLIVLARKKWLKYQFTKQKYQQAVTLLTEQESTHAIRASLKLIAAAEYWNTNLTISQWGELWKKKYKIDDSFDIFCKELSDLCYQSQTSHNMRNINKSLINLLSNKNVRTRQLSL